MQISQQLHIHEDDKAWEEAVLAFITAVIQKTLSVRDYCSISLSGGSTPRRIYEKLALEGTQRGIAWGSIRLYWGDERAVPHDHPDSNYKMVKEALLDHIDIPTENIMPFQAPEHPEKSAEAYAVELQQAFPAEGPSFDLSLLGLGDDGHTASIFPNTELVHEQEAWAKSVYLKDKDTFRISVTAPVINRSGQIAFLVKGGNKAPALKEVLTGSYQPEMYPAQLIRKTPDVHFFLDEEAAAQL